MYIPVLSSPPHSNMHRVPLTCKPIIRPYPCFFFFAVIMFFLPFHDHFMLHALQFLSAFHSIAPWSLASCPSIMHAWKSLPFSILSPHLPLLRSWGSHPSPREQQTLVKSNSWSCSSWPKWLVPAIGCDRTYLGTSGEGDFLLLLLWGFRMTGDKFGSFSFNSSFLGPAGSDLCPGPLAPVLFLLCVLPIGQGIFKAMGMDQAEPMTPT